MVQFFFIGGTGHIGGAVLDRILQQYPEAGVKVLVRDEQKGSRLVAKYPNVQHVVGDTTRLETLETASREADIVINTTPDITHEEGIKAILRGMKDHSGAKPYYIHTSGASLIWDEPDGSKDARTWDDMADIGELSAFKETYTHAITDKIVRDAADDVNVAIMSPGFVMGISPSTEHPTPITTPALMLTSRAFKCGWQIAQGENAHACIHVLDLARMYMILVDSAMAGLAGRTADPAPPFPLWGPEAYYFGAAEQVPFAKFMAHLAPVLHELGVVHSTEIKSVSVKEAARASFAGEDYDPTASPPPPDTWANHISIMYGINMRVRGSRMARLGWKPENGPVVDTFPEVMREYLRLEKERGGR